MESGRCSVGWNILTTFDEKKGKHANKKTKKETSLTNSEKYSGNRLGGPQRITFAPQAVSAHRFDLATLE